MVSIFRRPNGCGGPAGAYLGLAILAAFIWITLGCGTPAPAADSVPGTIHVQPDLPIAQPAAATAVAVRLTTTSTAPVEQAAAFNAADYVNGLTYGWHNMAAPMEAFRVVAISRGWTQTAIDRWTPFTFDLIAKESGGCPNTKGGDLFVEGTCDQYTRHGHAEDSGFGQATYSLFGPTGVTCKALGVCSQAQVIADPWTSMLASVVLPLELLGRYPWCDYAGAGDWHNCSLIGRNERPLP